MPVGVARPGRAQYTYVRARGRRHAGALSPSLPPARYRGGGERGVYTLCRARLANIADSADPLPAGAGEPRGGYRRAALEEAAIERAGSRGVLGVWVGCFLKSGSSVALGSWRWDLYRYTHTGRMFDGNKF